MKRSRSTHVRSKIVFLLASMAALWAFAAFVTVRDGLNLLFVNTVGEFGVTTSDVVEALQAERRLSVAAVAGARQSDELTAARARTDAILAQWREEALSRGLRVAASDELLNRTGLANRALAGLPELRADVDGRALDRREVAASYTSLISLNFDIFAVMAVLDDQEIARQSRALVSLSEAGELLSQQDALIAGVLASGRVE